MEFDNNQHLICRCPFCSAEYDLDGAKVIGEEEESTMVYVTCSECESSIIAIVAMSGLGIVSLGLVTDMTEDDTKRFVDSKGVTSNELLSIYELLEKNNSTAIKTLTSV
ncbi:MAG: hypothetical protein WD972_01740 [Candidatus Andersenbacteria bacterium]|jgi:hypothetical protein